MNKKSTYRLLSYACAALLVLLHGCGNGPGSTALLPPKEDTLVLDSTMIGIRTVANGLEVPWDMQWGPDNLIWYTEQNGKISRLDPGTGESKLLLKLPDAYRKRLGLLSMVLHPDMKTQPYVFVNYLFLKDSAVFSKIVRYTYRDNTLRDPLILLQWPAHAGHNGSRMAIGPDGKLMVATGDITKEATAQNPHTPNGKVLRLNTDGTIPADNPWPNSPVWAMGFRVPQGLVYSSDGRLYSAEHGDATDDEVNLIRKGMNYGYPYVTGFRDNASEDSFCNIHPVAPPLRAWTPTIAPAAIGYYDAAAIPEWRNVLLLVTLKTQSLRVLSLNAAGDSILREQVYLEKKFGRLRAICVAPSGDVYISTSNRDWNPPAGFPVSGDDRILRLRKITTLPPDKRSPQDTRSNTLSASPVAANGNTLYDSYCSSCHQPGGKGLPGSFPPLANNPLVAGDKNKLLHVVLHGLSGPVQVNGAAYDQAMPAFSFLGDEDLSKILSFIRTQWNQAAAITVQDVGHARKTPQP